jgi:hypothetical protein
VSAERGADGVNGHNSVAEPAAVPAQRAGTPELPSAEPPSAEPPSAGATQAPDTTPSANASSVEPPAVGSAATRSGRRLRRVLLVVAVVLACVVTVAGAFGIFVYDKATAIDRSTPTVAVRNYLQTALVDRDVARLALFVCSRWSPSEAMAALGERPDPSVRVNWGVTSVQESGDRAEATVEITFSAAGNRDVQTWRFAVVREDGWRVCDVKRSDSLNP